MSTRNWLFETWVLKRVYSKLAEWNDDLLLNKRLEELAQMHDDEDEREEQERLEFEAKLKKEQLLKLPSQHRRPCPCLQ